MSVDHKSDDSSSTPKPDPNGPGWEERLHEVGNRMEEELKRVISYINDEVVPEVRRASSDARRNGSDALRAAAQQMEKLAQKMDERDARSRAGSTNPPPPDEAK